MCRTLVAVGVIRGEKATNVLAEYLVLCACAVRMYVCMTVHAHLSVYTSTTTALFVPHKHVVRSSYFFTPSYMYTDTYTLIHTH